MQSNCSEKKRVEATKQISEKKQEIKYNTREYVVGYLVENFNKEEFYIPLEYQRNFVWKERHSCFFIESVLIGLPIPYMFFSDSDDGRVEIVDGAQRMSTLARFVNNELRLKGLEILTEANGMLFSDFQPEIQRRFLNSSFRVVFLEEGTTVQVRQEIFKRINSSGMKLKPQEVRRGSLEGAFKELVNELVLNQDFNMLVPRSIDSENRYEGAELITRFFAYSDAYPEFEKYNGYVAKFLDRYTEDMNKKLSVNAELVGEYKERFANMISYAKEALGEQGFRKDVGGKSTPHARFEALSVGIAVAQMKKNDLQISDMREWINCEEFSQMVKSDAANVKTKLKKRISYVVDKLLKNSN